MNRSIDLRLMIPRAALAIFWLAVIAVSIIALAPPPTVPASADPLAFSSARAMEKLKVIAKEPHACGSPGHAAVREYLVGELRALGLAPELQEERVENARPMLNLMSQGRIVNIVARIRGRETGKALLIAAHYDSVPVSPGASDDGAAVAAMLETARALLAGSPPRHDVILLMTDAEEICLCGAEAFARRHAWAAEVGAVLNFEARGTRGPSTMFETSAGNAWLIAQLARAGSRPLFASSLSYEVYRRLPNDTDLTRFKQAGMAGLNFAYIHNVEAYHTANDNLAHLDQRSLQHHGQQMLAVARRLAEEDLPGPPSGNAIYFDVLGRWLARYPAGWALPLAGLGALMWLGVAVWGVARGRMRWPFILLGAAWLVALAALIGIACEVVTRVIYASYLQRTGASPLGFRANPWIFLWLASLAAFSAAAMGERFARRFGGFNLAMGAWLVWTLLGLAAAEWVPGGSYLFFWPMLFCLVSIKWRLLLFPKAPGSAGDLAIAALGPVVGLLLWSPLVYQVFVAMTLKMAGVLGGLVVLAMSLLAAGLERSAPSAPSALTGEAE